MTVQVIRRRMQLQSMAAAAAASTHGTSTTAAVVRHHAVHSAHIAAGSTASHTAWGRIMTACVSIVKADGPKGFYAGLMPNLLQVLPSAALSYATYEFTKHALGVEPKR